MSSPGVSYNNQLPTLHTGGSESYDDFLKAKAAVAQQTRGITVDPSEVNPILHPHQIDIVVWALAGGSRAIFAAFGLGKTVIQLEIIRLCLKHNAPGLLALIVAPLGVKQEFQNDIQFLRTGEHEKVTDEQREVLRQWIAADFTTNYYPNVQFIQSDDEITDQHTIYITNAESVREKKITPSRFFILDLDEGSYLRSFGSKTFSEMLFGSAQQVPYRFVATATPSPNDHQELLAYAHFLGVMDIGESRTRFFQRNSEKADELTLRPHKKKEFWMWVASWAVFIEKPSDLGYSDESYTLPEFEVRWHEVRPKGEIDAGEERYGGQRRMFNDTGFGLSEAAREKRESLEIRIEKMLELIAERPDDHCILWHDLESERKAIEKAVPDVVSVYGSQKLEVREENVIGFARGKYPRIAGKPVMLGSGPNLQHHCSWEIFLGIGFKFNDFIQAIHRVLRYLQKHKVIIDIIHTEAERSVKADLLRKWKEHEELREEMRLIIKEYGLSSGAIAKAMTRSMGVKRVEVVSENYRLINNDNIYESPNIESDSQGLLLTSIPFSTQYEYTPSYHDFGHTDDDEHFFKQMDFLTPNCFRSLMPGRFCVVHVKDRVVPGGITGLGFQTVSPFHSYVIQHYMKHGFAYMGMDTIVTDVVRENNQTYRLSWSEQNKDATCMGVGMPEYLLYFRKPPSSNANGYADEKVKRDPEFNTLGRWQVDAHAFKRSSGDRLLKPSEWNKLTYKEIFQLFKKYSLEEIYDYEYHVKIGDELRAIGKLPVDFMLLQPQSWDPSVWTDVTRMRTLNTFQAAKGKENHLCPLPLDIVERTINRFSMPGESVFDPFAGLGTVPYVALKLGRKALGIELSPQYFADSIAYCKSVEYKKNNVPTLFDLTGDSQRKEAA